MYQGEVFYAAAAFVAAVHWNQNATNHSASVSNLVVAGSGHSDWGGRQDTWRQSEEYFDVPFHLDYCHTNNRKHHLDSSGTGNKVNLK